MTPTEITALAERLEESACRFTLGSAAWSLGTHECLRTATALRALLAEREGLRGALVRVNQMLMIPAAEYVPAIPEVWAVIEAALSDLAPKEPNNGN